MHAWWVSTIATTCGSAKSRRDRYQARSHRLCRDVHLLWKQSSTVLATENDDPEMHFTVLVVELAD
jgi:hypothetical protein